MPTITAALEQLHAIARDEPRATLATLVATRGGTSGREGARMWAGATGRVLGAVTLGGCVEARVLEEVDAVLASGRPRLLSIDLGEEEAWDFGLTCSGSVDVLLEPVEVRSREDPVVMAAQAVEEELRAGRSVATISLLEGSVARLVVRADGTRAGTLGEPALDEEGAALAHALLSDGSGRPVSLREGQGSAVGAFCEVHSPPTTLFVIGAGPVAVPLVHIARVLGLRTVVLDGRERFATRERFPEADEILVGNPERLLLELPLARTSFVVLVAHDYKYDLPALRTVLATDVGYVGLLGSRRRGRAILGFLADEGVPAEALARVRVPIGLDIGARTAAEIALSVMAEALAVRSGRTGGPLRDGAMTAASGG